MNNIKLSFKTDRLIKTTSIPKPFSKVLAGYAPIKSKLQHPPPPRANPGHLTTFCARGVGNLTGKAFPGVGNLTFAWVGWGKLNRKFQIPNVFFFPGAKVATSYTSLENMEDFKGRDVIFVRDWLQKKGLQKLSSIFEGMYEK